MSYTLDQLRRYGLRPDTSLGQHFLVDDNILRVTVDLARLDTADVVYEPGPGVGVLTAFLAQRVAHVHAVELDRRLEQPLTDLAAGTPNITVHWADAARLDLSTLEPGPTALVSNLPYHVATPIIAETLGRSPGVTRICGMVQREIADRLGAEVNSSVYGAVSVFVQTLCRRSGFHPVSRSVFLPQPNVDSALIALERIPEPAREIQDSEVSAYASFVRTAFAHRRKTLANNLLTGRGIPRDRVVAALQELGHGASARPQELEHHEFAAVFRELNGAES